MGGGWLVGWFMGGLGRGGEGRVTCSVSGVDEVFDAVEARRGFDIAKERCMYVWAISAVAAAGSAKSWYTVCWEIFACFLA